jgi:hypothetical protein
MSKGVCIFCRSIVGHRKRTRLLLKHAIWVSGNFLVCPGTGCYAKPIDEQPSSSIESSRPQQDAK